MNEARSILVVEDEEHLAQGIAENLEAEGFRATVAGEGRYALELVRRGGFDLVLLDVMLPGLDGYTICETARAEGIQTPILFLTAKGSVDDRVRGLEAGGDDYLPKPFHLHELLARVRTILKRWSWYARTGERDKLLRFGDNEFDFATFQGRSWDGTLQQLTQKEAIILKVLAEREGEVVSREDLLDKAWGYELYPSTRTIDNFIVRLRKRFERDAQAPRHFHTVRGIGYRFTAKGESP
jgi:two-component system, OmpR family, alkaline phosphatase synthesis response regulator PhoP